jgi:hypothetical protein
MSMNRDTFAIYAWEIVDRFVRVHGADFPDYEKAACIATERQMSAWLAFKGQSMEDQGQLRQNCTLQLERENILTDRNDRIGIFYLPSNGGIGDDDDDHGVYMLMVQWSSSNSLEFRLIYDQGMDLAEERTFPLVDMAMTPLRMFLSAFCRSKRKEGPPPRERYRSLGIPKRRSSVGGTFPSVAFPLGTVVEVLYHLTLSYPYTFNRAALIREAMLQRYLAVCDFLTTLNRDADVDLETIQVVAGVSALALTDEASQRQVVSPRIISILITGSALDHGGHFATAFHPRRADRNIVPDIWYRFYVIITERDHHTLLVVDEQQATALHCDSVSLGSRTSYHFSKAREYVRLLLGDDLTLALEPWRLPMSEGQLGRECGLYVMTAAFTFTQPLPSSTVAFGSAEHQDHVLKGFRRRVQSIYDMVRTLIQQLATHMLFQGEFLNTYLGREDLFS